MHVWNVLHADHWKYRMQKSPFWHHRTTLSGCIFAAEARVDNQKKNLLNNNTSSTCPHNMVNFGLLTAEICWRVWDTPASFNGFRILAALLHGTLVVCVSHTLQRWTDGATYSAGRPSRWALAHILVSVIRYHLQVYYGPRLKCFTLACNMKWILLFLITKVNLSVSLLLYRVHHVI